MIGSVLFSTASLFNQSKPLVTTLTQTQILSATTGVNFNVINNFSPNPTPLHQLQRGLKMFPKRTKTAKRHKGRVSDIPVKQFLVKGDYAFVAIEPGRVKNKTIQVVNDLLSRMVKPYPKGNYWIRMFPHTQVSSKSADVRRGRGKGDIDHWAARCREGKVLIELINIPGEAAKSLFRRIRGRLPLRTKLVRRAPDITVNQFVEETPPCSHLEEYVLLDLDVLPKKPVVDMLNRT